MTVALTVPRHNGCQAWGWKVLVLAGVRSIIKDFNARGLAALEPKRRPGRRPVFDDDTRATIAEIATCPPKLLGCPFTRWSLEKLREYLVAEKVVASISLETLRSILHARKVKLRRTKTWEECNNPRLRAKKNASAGT